MILKIVGHVHVQNHDLVDPMNEDNTFYGQQLQECCYDCAHKVEILTTRLHSSINLVGLGLGNPLLSPKNQFRFVDMAEVGKFWSQIGLQRLFLSLFNRSPQSVGYLSRPEKEELRRIEQVHVLENIGRIKT